MIGNLPLSQIHTRRRFRVAARVAFTGCLLFIAAGCTAAPDDSVAFETVVAATVFAEQTEAPPIPTARPTRTTTPVAAPITPTPPGGVPSTALGQGIGRGNAGQLVLGGTLNLEWPYMLMGPTALALSPEAGLLAVGSLNGVYLLDSDTFHLIAHITDPGAVSSLAFSPAGDLIAAGTVGSIHLLDTASGYPLGALEIQDPVRGGVTGVAFSPDGKTLLSSTRDQVHFWDVNGAQPLLGASPTSAEQTIEQVAFSPDGLAAFVQVCDRDWIYSSVGCRLLYSESKDFTAFLNAEGANAIAVSYQAGSMGLTSRFETTFFEGSEEIAAYDWGGDAIALSPDGNLAAIRVGRSLQVAEVQDGSRRSQIEIPAEINGFLFAGDSTRLLTWSSCIGGSWRECNQGTVGSLEVWNPASQERQTLADAFAPFTHLTFSPSGDQLALRDAFGQLIMLEMPSGRPKYRLEPRCDDSVWGGCFNAFRYEFPDDLQLDDESLHDWDAAFSPDGEYLLVGLGSASIQIFRADDGEAFLTLESDDCAFGSSATFSPDGAQVITASFQDEILCIWDFPEGELAKTLEHDPAGDSAGVTALTLSEDGALLAAGTRRGEVAVWKTDGWQRLWSYPIAPEAEILDLDFAGDGQWLVVLARDGVLRIRSSLDGTSIGMLSASSLPTQVDVSPDGSLIASSHFFADTGASLFSLPDGEQHGVGGGGGSGVTFSPDGRWLVSAAGNGTLEFWVIP